MINEPHDRALSMVAAIRAHRRRDTDGLFAIIAGYGSDTRFLFDLLTLAAHNVDILAALSGMTADQFLDNSTEYVLKQAASDRGGSNG